MMGEDYRIPAALSAYEPNDESLPMALAILGENDSPYERAPEEVRHEKKENVPMAALGL